MKTDEVNIDTVLLIAGSYEAADNGGLRVYNLNLKTLQTAYLYDVPVGNASYMAVSASGVIYAVTESDAENSLLTAFNAGNDGYNIISRVKIGADSPCYVALTPDGRFVLTANYGDGTVAAFPVRKDGGAGECCLRLRFIGHGPVPRRQDCSRIHCISFTPDRKYMLVNDLGNDSIYGFTLLEGCPQPVCESPAFTLKLHPGSGPRHIVFNTAGDRAYLINEISDTVTVLGYDGKSLTPLQNIRANTEDARGAGDIRLSEDGKYLFASLRLKNDGIAAFRVDRTDGTLEYIGHTATGIHPRNINRYKNLLFVSCRDSGKIEIYSEKEGQLILRNSISQPKAVFSMLIFQ